MNNHTVLVIEDDAAIRETVLEILEEHGYAAVGALNGRDALEKLRSATRLPSLILLDMMMPVMDGRAFREQQLKEPNLAAIPVVVVSAYRDLGADLGAMQAVVHLRKPLDLDVLLGLAKRYCRGEDDR